MRIPFPERVKPAHALIFATSLLAVELLEGTNPAFAGCGFCFILVAAMAFNIAGGIAYPSGAFIFFNTLFTILLPLTAKAILGQPADAYLRTPVRTMEVYLCGMVGMFAAAIVSRRFRRRRAFLSGMLPDRDLRSAYVGSAAFSVLLYLFISFFATGGNGSIGSFLVQINRFPILTFVLGTIYAIKRTNGRRSLSGPLMLMIVSTSLISLLTFSKELFLTPFFAWALTAALMRYRLRWLNIVAFGAGLYVTATFMVPYAQYGRNFVAPGLSQTQIAAYLLSHMDEVQAGYEEGATFAGNIHFYDRHRGLLTRLEVFSVDDALVEITDRQGPIGYHPIIAGIDNMVPHFLWPDKPSFSANTYAHEIGILSDADNTTGVSFSPSADAYHEGGILAVLVLQPVILMLIFLILDSVVGDVRLNPVGLLMTILVSRTAFEASLIGVPYLVSQALVGVVIASLVCRYILPVIGYLFSGAKSSAADDSPSRAGLLATPLGENVRIL